MTASNEYRTGYVALIGKPNVGKSTLLNAILKQKISIVSQKPQTTRHKILGILSNDEFQAILLDTPGLIDPKYLLHENMLMHAHSAMKEADIILYLVEANEFMLKDIDSVLHSLPVFSLLPKPPLLVLTKIDLLSSKERSLLEQRFSNEKRTIMFISAMKGTGLAELERAIEKGLPLHPPLYPPEMLSEAPEKFFVSELIREKIFELYAQEIPYSTTVEIVVFKERGEKKHFISADIIVERSSQRGILIGKEGGALKRLGSEARPAIESFIDHQVFLELHVKVREGWRDKKEWLRRFGYSVD